MEINQENPYKKKKCVLDDEIDIGSKKSQQIRNI